MSIFTLLGRNAWQPGYTKIKNTNKCYWCCLDETNNPQKKLQFTVDIA
ncbi:Uncharacterised protein [Citrobacter koseri]|nr:Uncharacterised protein [Citrobacter koseri]